MSQAALAQACGLSQGAIANYESKHRKSAKHIFLLAQALNVSAAWLAMGEGAMELPPSDALTLSTYRLAQPGGPPPQNLWPFTRLSPETYWALSADEREVVESTLVSLVQSLQNKPVQR